MRAPYTILSKLEKSQSINQSDVEFAHLWVKLDPTITSKQILVFLATFHYLNKGHVAIDQAMIDDFLITVSETEKIDLKEVINDSILVGQPGDFKPFILFEDLLYQHKSFEQEKKVSEWLFQKSLSKIELDKDISIKIDESYSKTESDQQLLAIYKSFNHPILFITGGPGTGKTYTVQQILLAHRAIFGDSYSIKIAAPTGKAAQRINDSLLDEESTFKAETIHQLLGIKNFIKGFKYSEGNYIPADLIVIDEASMMDLSLWSSLTKAISSKCRLIIVGDPFQLASVESGSVLSDICSFSEKDSINNPIKDSIIKLESRHRFSKDSGIHQFADSVNNMDPEIAFQILKNSNFEDIRWVEPSPKNISDVFTKYAIDPALSGVDNLIEEYRLLSALRKGPYGSIRINSVIEQQIKKQKGVALSKEWFHNRIIMVNKNDYKVGVQNGEIGSYDENTNAIFFGEKKQIDVHQLSNFESGYCITIHKSQGSEYDNVAIILPEHENALLTKELLYTAVTRARKSVLVVGNKNILIHCITKKTKRKSGLNKQMSLLLG